MQSAVCSDRLASNSLACSTSRNCCGSLVHGCHLLHAHRERSALPSSMGVSRVASHTASVSHIGCIGFARQTGQQHQKLSTRRARRSHLAQVIHACSTADVPLNNNQPHRQHKPFSRVCLLLGAAILPGNGFADLGQNYVFMAGFWGWFLAQTCKIFTKRWRKGVWDLKAIVDSGGMPSSHSALCSAVTTATALELGLGSSLFAVSLAFSLIVMYDAAGVRRHAGKQAEVLNILLEDLLEGHSVSETKLKEVLGHTPIQVCVGALLGVVVGLFFPIPPAVPIV